MPNNSKKTKKQMQHWNARKTLTHGERRISVLRDLTNIDAPV